MHLQVNYQELKLGNYPSFLNLLYSSERITQEELAILSKTTTIRSSLDEGLISIEHLQHNIDAAEIPRCKL